MSDIAMRIQERLDLVGKSASAASLEAGLGRSALQDILSGKSQNPRLDTLRKLLGPLECSLSYLTGDPPERLAKAPPIEWGEQVNQGHLVHRVEIVGAVEIGTIRGNEDDLSEFNPVIFVERDQRFPEADLFGYVVRDKSLTHVNIQPETDVLLTVRPGPRIRDLRTGAILVIERIVPHAFDSEDDEGCEITAREVQYVGDELHLLAGAQPASAKAIVIAGKNLQAFISGETLQRPMVRLAGIVVRVLREMPV